MNCPAAGPPHGQHAAGTDLQGLDGDFYFCCFIVSANNAGTNKRQITDLVDQSIQINSQCFVVTADNRYILVCGFWDKSFRVYFSETGAGPVLDL